MILGCTEAIPSTLFFFIFFMSINAAQLDYIVEQYAEIVLDRMDYKDMEQYVYDSLTDYYGRMGKTELREHIIEMENSGCPEDNLFDELLDNVKDVTVYGEPLKDDKVTRYGLDEGETLSFPVKS
mgnify:FL=1